MLSSLRISSMIHVKSNWRKENKTHTQLNSTSAFSAGCTPSAARQAFSGIAPRSPCERGLRCEGLSNSYTSGTCTARATCLVRPHACLLYAPASGCRGAFPRVRCYDEGRLRLAAASEVSRLTERSCTNTLVLQLGPQTKIAAPSASYLFTFLRCLLLRRESR